MMRSRGAYKQTNLVIIVKMHSPGVGRSDAKDDTNEDGWSGCGVKYKISWVVKQRVCLPMKNCKMACPLNHMGPGMNVLKYRANKAPAGKKSRNPTTQKMA
jgi:hypothetical protein